MSNPFRELAINREKCVLGTQPFRGNQALEQTHYHTLHIECCNKGMNAAGGLEKPILI